MGKNIYVTRVVLLLCSAVLFNARPVAAQDESTLTGTVRRRPGTLWLSEVTTVNTGCLSSSAGPSARRRSLPAHGCG